MIQFGNLSLNLDAHKGWTKEQFLKEYAGKSNVDLDFIWNEIKKDIEIDTINELSTKDKKTNNK